MNMFHAGAGERPATSHATGPRGIPAHPPARLKVVAASAASTAPWGRELDAVTGERHSDNAPPVFQDLRRFRVPPGFRGRSLVVVALWRIAQASLFAWSPQPLHGWRRQILRLFGARIGAGVRIMPSARIAYPWKLSIGDHAWIGSGAELYNLAPIAIGAHAVISQRSYLCAAGHAVDRADFRYTTAPIVIGDQAWVAMDAMVGPGVAIGDGAVLGARSSAFHDVPAGVIAMGCPARPGRRRPAEPALPGGAHAQRPEYPASPSPSHSARAAAAASAWIRHGHAGPRQPG
ncbi:WcaF family extracellular polysaccharide biosynthesis acetyltransferase [Camelimonas sp. ID_303_24]